MEIFIDTDSLVSQFEDITQEQIDNLVDFTVKSVVAEFAFRLNKIAGQELHQTKKRYQNAIRVLDTGRFKGAILISYSDPLVGMIEEGCSAFDMKNGFEKSSKKHLKKDGGWYMTIPLSSGTPDSVGESDVFSSIMPSEVYNVMKVKPTNIPTSSGNNKSEALTENEIPEKYRTPSTRALVTNTITNKVFEEYKNKTSIFEGMIKVNDPVTGQNTYTTFRRVSDKSDENSWIFSGIQAYNLADKAMSELETNMEQILNDSTNSGLASLGIT